MIRIPALVQHIKTTFVEAAEQHDVSNKPPKRQRRKFIFHLRCIAITFKHKSSTYSLPWTFLKCPSFIFIQTTPSLEYTSHLRTTATLPNLKSLDDCWYLGIPKHETTTVEEKSAISFLISKVQRVLFVSFTLSGKSTWPLFDLAHALKKDR